jgi:hypothetical protein
MEIIEGPGGKRESAISVSDVSFISEVPEIGTLGSESRGRNLAMKSITKSFFKDESGAPATNGLIAAGIAMPSSPP